MSRQITAVYVRVSTDLQAESGLGLAAQVDRCRAYAKAVGLDEGTRVEVFEDAGVSAKNTDRPALGELMRQVRARAVSAVIVLKVDRLARSTLDVLRMVETFDRHKVAFASVSEQLDTRTPSGRMVLTILAAVAQAEREAISERTKAAIGAKLRQGYAHGFCPLGYEARDGRLVPVEDEQETVRVILDLRNKGWSLRAIGAYLTLHCHSTKRGGRWGAQNVANVIRRAERRNGGSPSQLPPHE